MEVIHYEERGDETSLTIRQRNTRLTAVRGARGIHVRLHSTAGEECGAVGAQIEVCFSCEEYELLLCELDRLSCDVHACCDEDERRVFDQDECEVEDDDDDGCLEWDDNRTVAVTVREVRQAIKGMHADDMIEFSE